MADDLTYIRTKNRGHLLVLDLGKGLWQFLKIVGQCENYNSYRRLDVQFFFVYFDAYCIFYILDENPISKRDFVLHIIDQITAHKIRIVFNFYIRIIK